MCYQSIKKTGWHVGESLGAEIESFDAGADKPSFCLLLATLRILCCREFLWSKKNIPRLRHPDQHFSVQTAINTATMHQGAVLQSSGDMCTHTDAARGAANMITPAAWQLVLAASPGQYRATSLHAFAEMSLRIYRRPFELFATSRPPGPRPPKHPWRHPNLGHPSCLLPSAHAVVNAWHNG